KVCRGYPMTVRGFVKDWRNRRCIERPLTSPRFIVAEHKAGALKHLPNKPHGIRAHDFKASLKPDVVPIYPVRNPKARRVVRPIVPLSILFSRLSVATRHTELAFFVIIANPFD